MSNIHTMDMHILFHCCYCYHWMLIIMRLQYSTIHIIPIYNLFHVTHVLYTCTHIICVCVRVSIILYWHGRITSDNIAQTARINFLSWSPGRRDQCQAITPPPHPPTRPSILAHKTWCSPSPSFMPHAYKYTGFYDSGHARTHDNSLFNMFFVHLL